MKTIIQRTINVEKLLNNYEVDIPDIPTFYKKDRDRYVAIYPQFTEWDKEHPHNIWEYKFIEINDKSITCGFFRVAEFSNLISCKGHRVNDKMGQWFIVEVLINEHDNSDVISKEEFVGYFNNVSSEMRELLFLNNDKDFEKKI